MGHEGELIQTVITYIVWMAAAGVLGVGANVCLGLCVYNDARYRADSNATLWGVLSGFFNIAALVYLIIQLTSKNKPVACMRCRSWMARDSYSCPYCGTPVYSGGKPVTPESREMNRGRRKLFLILFIVFMAVGMVVGVVAVAQYITSMLGWAQQIQSY